MVDESIYDYGFNKDLNRPIETEYTGVVYDTLQNSLNASQILSGGSLTLKSLSIGGLVKQVAPGDDINTAIDAVSREGGGTVQLLAKTYYFDNDINLKENVSLIGAGSDITILDFKDGSAGIKCTSENGVRLAHFRIRNSGNTGAINFNDADRFTIENVYALSNTNDGFFIQDGCQDFLLINCRSEQNVNGFTLSGGGSGNVLQRFTLVNCNAFDNTGIGYKISTTTNMLFYGSLIGCRSSYNDGDGFDFSADSASAFVVTLTSCVSAANTGKGYDIGANCQRISLINCGVGVSNTGDDFEINGVNCTVIGCEGDDFDVNSSDVMIGNSIATGTSADPNTYLNLDGVEGTLAQSDLNRNGNTRTTRRVQTLKNNSGAGVRQGNLVVLDAVASGDNIDTTATNGDMKVWGMADESISNGNWGIVLTEGFTTNLWVWNSAASIAVGDPLSAYSHAYYAKKATTGEMAFAIACEAPSTSTAIIDALIIKPRQQT